MKKKNNFNWWLVPAILCGIIAFTGIVFYVITLNMALVLLILSAIAGTGFSLYRVINFSGGRFDGISEQGPVKGAVNAFCIYGKLEGEAVLADYVQFEEVVQESLLGDRWFFEDLKKWYHVIINAPTAAGAWKAFELPDAEYTDPARLSIQLNMGRVNEFFQLDATLFDQLKPWIIFAAISIIGFLIFLSGS